MRCSSSKTFFVFSWLLKQPGITPVCKKCTAFAIPIKIVNLSDHLSALSTENSACLNEGRLVDYSLQEERYDVQK